MIDISPEYLQLVKDILKQHVPQCEVRAFGSRHNWVAKPYSDLDIAIVGNDRLAKKQIYDLQEAFEESILPFRVDVLDWWAISDEFRAIIEQGYSVIQEVKDKLPTGWVVKKLGDVVDYVTDKMKTVMLSLHDYVSTENMLPNCEGIIISSNVPSSGNVTQYIYEDILISNIRPYFKKIWLADKSGGCSNDVLVLRNRDNNEFCSKYLYYYLTTNHFFDYVMAGSKGTKMPRGDKSQILQYQMNIPPLAEQQEIAAILSSLDDKIELNQQINKNLEEMAQTIFKQWFIDFNFPDENGNPYRDSGGAMVDSEIGLIPYSWSVGKICDVSTVTSGKRPKNRQENKNLQFHIPLYGASGVMGFVDDALFDKTLLVIGRVGTHGIVNRVNGKSWLSDNTLVIDSKFYNFMYFCLKSIDYANLNRGAVQPLLTQTDIKNYQLTIPSYRILSTFETMVSAIFNDIDNSKSQNEKLSDLRETLLPKLISGEIKI